MWEHNLLMVSPNRNIAKYEGWEKGTHTFQRIKIKEQGVASLSSLGFNTIANDKTADAWLASNIFSENMAGCLKGLIVTFALKLIRIFK